MKLTIFGGMAAAAALCAAPAMAQVAPAASPIVAAAPTPAVIAAPVMTNAVLRSGTELPLRLLETLTSMG
jgi:hypothetical protein